MAVSPNAISFRIRDLLAVRVRLGSLSISVQKKNKAKTVFKHPVQGRAMTFVLAGGSAHQPDRGVPFIAQVMVGEGIPSAWQSSLTVSPGAYN